MKVRLLEGNNVSISYNNKPILTDISFEMEEGEWVLLQGMNGEGKTTFIKTLLNLHSYTGSIKLKDKELKEYSYKELSQTYSYLPQKFENIPNISVSDFLSLSVKNKDKEDRLIQRFSLTSLLNVRLTELSIGQLQLIFLVYTLSIDTPILILDEPLSSLDVNIRKEIFDIVKEESLNKRTVIVVSHTIDSLFIPDRIITLSNKKCYDTSVIVKNRIPYSTPSKKILSIKPFAISAVILTILHIFFITEPVETVWLILYGAIVPYLSMIFQSLFKNNIATPCTLGIASTSLLTKNIIASLGCTSSILNPIFSALCALPIIALCLFKNIDVKNLFLFYISLTTISFYTLTTYFQNIVTNPYIPDVLSLIFIPFVIIPTFFIHKEIESISLLSIDSDIAKLKGFCTGKILFKIIGLSIVPISLLVSHIGLIFLVGLSIPYIIKCIFGDCLRKNAKYVCLSGIVILLLSDIIASIMSIYFEYTTTQNVVFVLCVLMVCFLFRPSSNREYR